MTVRTARIRIEDLEPLENLTEQEMAKIFGAGRKGKWQFSGQAMEVLEVRQVMSAVTVAMSPTDKQAGSSLQAAAAVDPLVPQQMVPAVVNALQQIRKQAGSISAGNNNIAFNSEAARKQFLNVLDKALGSQVQGQTPASLRAAGITVISRASLNEIDKFLSNRTAARQDLIVLRFQRTESETVTLSTAKSEQMTIGNKKVAASMGGSVSGTLEISGNLVFGLDRSGRAFVREGSTLTSKVQASGTITTSASPNSQVGLSLTGTGNIKGSSTFKVNDGDANTGENLYLAVDKLFSGFESNDVFEGEMDFKQLNAAFKVPGLSAPVSVPAQLKWNASLGKADLKIDQAAVDNAITDAAARTVVQATGRLAEKARQLADRVSDIPVVGEKIESDLTRKVDSMLKLTLPQGSVRDYLANRGFQIKSTIGLSQLLAGNLSDVFVVTWQLQELGSAITGTAAGSFGKTDGNGIGFEFGGTFTAQPQYDIKMTFGVDVKGGFFLQEGSAVGMKITAGTASEFKGQAKIPKLTNVTVTIPKGQQIINASLSTTVLDGDSRRDERLYLADLSGNSFVTVADAGLKLDAKMSMNSPVQQLPTFIRSTLNGLLPDSISWTAGVSYDVATKKLDYNINKTSLTEIVAAFQGADGIEDALKNYMLNRIAENNPIPESTQQFLGTKIPLLEQNVMDLLDIPKATQYVIAPLAFRGKAAPSVPGDTLDFRFDLFNPASIGRMLSGETYDIVSLNIDQRFEKDLAKITVIPETVVASYFGIVNATVEVNLTPGFFFEIDMLTGIDSSGFYIEGVHKDALAKDIDPNFKLGGKLEARVIAEGDLFLVVDLLRVTGTIGIEAYGDMTFVSPHADTLKVRVGDIKPDQIVVGLGVDLTLQMQGEVGLVEYDQWDKDVWLYTENGAPQARKIPLYRSNKVSLADIQDQIAEYKERLQSQGKQVIFAAAAATHDPHFVAAAIGIIYNDSGMGETVRKLVVDFNMRVDQAAEALSKAGKKISEIAAPLWEHCNNDLNKFAAALKAAGAETGELIRQLWDKGETHFNKDLNKFAEALKVAEVEIGRIATEVWSRLQGDVGAKANQLASALKSVNATTSQIAFEVYNRADRDILKLAAALKSVNTNIGEIATEVWSRLQGDVGAKANQLASALKSVNATTSQIAFEVYNRAGGSLNRLVSALKAAGASPGEIADEVWIRSGRDLNKLAGALQSIGAGLGDIGTQVWNRAEGDLNKLAGALVSVGDSARGVAQALGRVSSDMSGIAQALNSRVTGNLSSIADAMWSISDTKVRDVAKGLGAVSRDATAIAAALSSKVTTNLSSIADAMYRGIQWTTYRTVATGLGSLTRNASSIAGALSGTLGASYSAIADAMYNGIGWTKYRDVAAGLGSLTRSASSIAGTLRNTLGASFGTISDAMWHGISWTSHRDVATGLGSVTRDASAIAGAMRNSIGASFRTIADAMYNGINWTTHTDVGRGLRAVTNDANVIAAALRNGAGAADSTIQSVLRSVGSGAANLNNAINSVSNAVNSAANHVNNVISSLANRPW
jgi:flagellar biosynthesis regulator FlaF